MIKLNCSTCGVEFETYPSLAKRRNPGKKYCSKTCSYKASELNNVSITDFKIQHYEDFVAAENLGDYSLIKLGTRKRNEIIKRKYNHHFFKNGICDEETAYVYGILITDGCLQEADGRKKITLKLTDRDIVEKVAKVMEYKNEIVHKGNTFKMVMNSELIFNDLKAMGCGINKTEIVKYPLIVDELDRHLIRGIIDGDGSWIQRKNRPDFTLKICGTSELMYGISRKILKQLKIHPSSVVFPTGYKMKNYCYIRYSKHKALQIRDWLYQDATIYGERKYGVSVNAELII